MRTRELVPLVCGFALGIALAYVLGIEPKSWASFLIVVPAMIITAFAVDWALDRREAKG